MNRVLHFTRCMMLAGVGSMFLPVRSFLTPLEFALLASIGAASLFALAFDVLLLWLFEVEDNG